MIDERKLQNLQNSISLIDIYAEMFRKGDYSFIVEGKDEDGVDVVHEKQRMALEILRSNKHEEFLYGGAAGGAKSWTGCSWIMFMAICYPGTKYFIARNELKDILDSVLVTFNKVAKEYGFTDFKFNAVKNYIQFGNGSHINFIEIKFKPSDPMFEDVGSTEYTCGWIEEVGEIHETGAAVIASRVGRHLNGKFGIKGVVFYTCNPKRNWAKRDFYDKDKAGTLEPEKAYLSCLITENPFIEKDYVRKLRKIGEKDKSLYERLFKGNWDYEDNPYQLCEQEMIDLVFSNDHVESEKAYLTADIARFGADKAVIFVWMGWKIVDMLEFDISKTTDISHAIMHFRRKYKIPTTRCVGDADGVGGGVIDQTGIKGFKNNARAIRKGKDMPNYRNLQVQCLYLLADKVNDGGLWIAYDGLTNKQKSEIKEDLSQIQRLPNMRADSKLDCKSKGAIKSDIGRSPDYRDALLMRVWFDLKKFKRNLVTKWT